MVIVYLNLGTCVKQPAKSEGASSKKFAMEEDQPTASPDLEEASSDHTFGPIGSTKSNCVGSS